MITATFDADKMKLTIKGHAECEPGETMSVVCASVSTLFYSAIYSFKQLEKKELKKFTYKDNKGDGYVCCEGGEKYDTTVKLVFWTVLNGLEAISKAYPEYLKFISQ